MCARAGWSLSLASLHLWFFVPTVRLTDCCPLHQQKEVLEHRWGWFSSEGAVWHTECGLRSVVLTDMGVSILKDIYHRDVIKALPVVKDLP